MNLKEKQDAAKKVERIRAMTRSASKKIQALGIEEDAEKKSKITDKLLAERKLIMVELTGLFPGDLNKIMSFTR